MLINHLIFIDFSYIFMLYVTEQPELSVGPRGVDEGLKRPVELLDGHLLLGLLVDGRAKWDQPQTQ